MLFISPFMLLLKHPYFVCDKMPIFQDGYEYEDRWNDPDRSTASDGTYFQELPWRGCPGRCQSQRTAWRSSRAGWPEWCWQIDVNQDPHWRLYPRRWNNR